MNKRIFWLMAVAVLVVAALVPLLALAQSDEGDTVPPNPPAMMMDEDPESEPVSTVITVTYFHGDRRCATCIKLESYAKEAIEAAFADKLADSSIVWRTVNYDIEENEHYINDYSLYTKALILSHFENGVETTWINLDRIWELVGDHDKYIAYVQEETRKFVAGEEADE